MIGIGIGIGIGILCRENMSDINVRVKEVKYGSEVGKK